MVRGRNNSTRFYNKKTAAVVLSNNLRVWFVRFVCFVVVSGVALGFLLGGLFLCFGLVCRLVVWLWFLFLRFKCAVWCGGLGWVFGFVFCLAVFLPGCFSVLAKSCFGLVFLGHCFVRCCLGLVFCVVGLCWRFGSVFRLAVVARRAAWGVLRKSGLTVFRRVLVWPRKKRVAARERNQMARPKTPRGGL